MKKIIFILSVLISSKSYSQDYLLTGKWASCISVCDGWKVTNKVCTKIEFKINHTVIITYPDAVENLLWQRNSKNEIIFKSLDKVESRTFSDSKIYILEFIDTYRGLAINEKEKENCYHLLGR